MSLTRILGFRSLFNSINATQIIQQRFSSKFTINFSDPAVQKYLHSIILEHEKLMTKSRTLEEAKRLQMIKPIVTTLEQRIALYDSIDNLKDLNKKEKDVELQKMIKEEAEIYLSRIQNIDSELQTDLLEPFLTEGGVMMEITAGAGGQEAMLFARELFEMYESYASYKEWEFDLASFDKSDIGGIKKASALIRGYGVEEFMKLEAGVHRVQRIPATEKGGRIHTSTVAVAVLPQASDIELEIPERDISIETKRASGAGGQHVNTTDSAVRIIHLPTGIAVECQEGRSQIKNKQIALEKLRTLLLKKYTEESNSKISSERKSQVGSSERNEKIRTYNYPQDRVTEHRPGGSTIHNLKMFMEGGAQLEQLQEALLKQQKYQALMDEINHFMKNYHGAENKST